MEVDLNRQFGSVIKDRENERKLHDSIEFKQCREEVKGKTKSTSDIAQLASDCLAEKLNGKGIKDLENLSSNLNLTDYQLISSNNVKEISKYLSNKLYKSLTGVDPNEKDPKKLSFRNKDRKMVDQRDLITLYKNQVGKNALLTISSYCFEDLRATSSLSSSNPNQFGPHWEKYFANPQMTISTVNDLGQPSFKSPSSGKDTYSDMLDSLMLGKNALDDNTADKTSLLGKFFNDCTKMIKELCENFPNSVLKVGAKSCVVKAKLANYRKTFSAIDKILNDKEFQDTGKSALVTELSANNGSLDGLFDDLTSITSTDILKGGSTDISKATECEKNPGSTGCEAFLGNKGSNDELYDNTEMNVAFRKEVEIAKVKTLKDQQLAEYLEANGYLNLNANSKESEIIAAIQARFDAEREGMIQTLNKELGSRQTKADVANSKTDDKTLIKKNATEVSEERARLAQVILFNNIITSQLSLKKSDGKGNDVSLGRNVNPLKKELAAASKDSGQINNDFFTGLQSSTTSGSAGSKVTGNESIGSITFLDTILGK